MSEEIRPALDALRRQRADYMARVAKIDTAIKALQDLDEGQVGGDGNQASHTGASSAASNVTGKSVLTRVLEVFKAQPYGVWTADSILEQFNLEGAPLEAAHPQNAVRNALSTALNNGDIERLGRGQYMSTEGANRAALVHDEPPSSDTPVGLGGIFKSGLGDPERSTLVPPSVSVRQ